MAKIIPETDLPLSLNSKEAIQTAYPTEIADVTESVNHGLSVLIECDKSMTGFVFSVLRDRLREDFSLSFIDGRRPPNQEPTMMGPSGLVATMLSQIEEAIRGGIDDDQEKPRIFILPHLDLLTTSSGGLTSEAKEAIAYLYENPHARWIGFRDPSLGLPKTITDLFPRRVSFLGVPRDRLHRVVTQSESRKLQKEPGLDVYKLYKFVSGVNVIQLRTLLESLNGEDYPEVSDPVWRQIRMSTLEGGWAMPDITLQDIGGYENVKKKITEEILDLLKSASNADDESSIKQIESLIPRGMIFEGPPGTGKTMFAKALASELGAAVQVVNGPELKSKWVGESEENLRKIFAQARASAPALIIFDEMDSFASRRDMHTAGSGVEHSMVNQLLTEMDGFNSNEMVFVIGTTNFAESLDSALMRPGRFEFTLNIAYPNDEDREAIIQYYDKKFKLNLTEQALKDMVRMTSYPLPRGGMWSGDHIQALCRAVARARLREGFAGETDTSRVEAARKVFQDEPKLSEDEKVIVATHECGHALVGMHMKHIPTISRISIQGNISGALGFVEHAEKKDKNIHTHEELFERIIVLFGGIVAEQEILEKTSIGSSHDLVMANRIARALVVDFGFESVTSVVAQSHKEISEDTKKDTDHRIRSILDRAESRAREIVKKNKGPLLALRTQLLEEEVIDAPSLDKLKASKSDPI